MIELIKNNSYLDFIDTNLINKEYFPKKIIIFLHECANSNNIIKFELYLQIIKRFLNNMSYNGFCFKEHQCLQLIPESACNDREIFFKYYKFYELIYNHGVLDFMSILIDYIKILRLIINIKNKSCINITLTLLISFIKNDNLIYDKIKCFKNNTQIFNKNIRPIFDQLLTVNYKSNNNIYIVSSLKHLARNKVRSFIFEKYKNKKYITNYSILKSFNIPLSLIKYLCFLDGFNIL